MGKKPHYDFIIAGSGFGGSITAMALVNSGFRVCLVEKDSHPRFAIGESSTPIADMVLRDFADRYNLPFLKKISRYGEWQKHYPEVTCGLKRGFSYFHHTKGRPFQSDRDHSKELLVAASKDDFNSDTNWLRSDVDSFLVSQAQHSGVDYRERTEVISAERDEKKEEWSLILKNQDGELSLKTRWILDATGSPHFSEKMFGTSSSTDGFETHSEAVFSHLTKVKPWFGFLKDHNFFIDDYPYNPDHSALHYLIEEGWIWMLRFNNDLLSTGLVIDRNTHRFETDDPKDIWDSVISSYPSADNLFALANQAESPGKWIKTGRLQRRLDRMFGRGWAALPHTTGFVDPLHSTGIAHTLTGIEKLLKVFIKEKTGNVLDELQQIEEQFFRELELIDLLVSACYRSRNHIELFTACTMLYFAASVTYEQERLKGNIPVCFLCANDSGLFDLVQSIHQKTERLPDSENSVQSLVREIREGIKPYNNVGLMNPDNKNMYRHTAAVL